MGGEPRLPNSVPDRFVGELSERFLFGSVRCGRDGCCIRFRRFGLGQNSVAEQDGGCVNLKVVRFCPKYLFDAGNTIVLPKRGAFQQKPDAQASESLFPAKNSLAGALALRGFLMRSRRMSCLVNPSLTQRVGISIERYCAKGGTQNT